MKGCTYRSLVMVFFVFCLPALNAHAKNLLIMTEIDPPAQYFDENGELTGFTVELVKKIQEKVGNSDAIEAVPWARAYRFIETQPNVVVFLMANNSERDPLFHWIGPVLEFTTGLYGLADSNLAVSSVEEAQSLDAIGVYKDDIRDQLLTEMGFENLERVANKTQNIKMLLANRVQVYAASSISFGSDALEAGLQPSDLKLIFPMQTVQAYVAMSKGTDAKVSAEWQSALDELKDDGTLLKLLSHYYPGAPMPGPPLREINN